MMLVIFFVTIFYHVNCLKPGNFVPTQFISVINGAKQIAENLPPTRLPRFTRKGEASIENLYFSDTEIEDYRVSFMFNGAKFSTPFFPVVRKNEVLHMIHFFFLHTDDEILKVKFELKYVNLSNRLEDAKKGLVDMKTASIVVKYHWKERPTENANIGLSLVYSILVFASVFVIIMVMMYGVMTNSSLTKDL